jgi:hypothetical protein
MGRLGNFATRGQAASQSDRANVAAGSANNPSEMTTDWRSSSSGSRQPGDMAQTREAPQGNQGNPSRQGAPTSGLPLGNQNETLTPKGNQGNPSRDGVSGGVLPVGRQNPTTPPGQPLGPTKN